MRPSLTQKQKKVLDHLKTEVKKTGTVPSLRSVAVTLDISHAAVAQTLKTLETKGYIRREGRYSRTIHILEPMGDWPAFQYQKPVPVIGQITAGLPMYAQQEWAGHLVVDSRIYPDPNLFALQIRGNSMTGAGILDKDFAICIPRQYAHDREIVVALIHNEEATVKRFFSHKNHIELRPENPEYSSRTYNFNDVLIQGKVIGIIRGPECEL
jgi:repressor LexA